MDVTGRGTGRGGTAQGFAGVAVGAAMLAVLALAFPAGCMRGSDDAEAAPVAVWRFTGPIESILNRKLAELQVIATNPVVAAAAAHRGRLLSRWQARRRDAEWRRNGEAWMGAILTNRAACAARDLGAAAGFAEILITDQHGLLVAATGKTTDYVQSDESWWQAGWAGGRGATLHGGVEFDASSGVQAIPLMTPLRDTNGLAVGVVKAVCDITTIEGGL